MDRTQAWGLIVLATLAAATLMGCGGEETAGPADEPSATTTATVGGDDGDRCTRVPKALKEGIASGLRPTGKETGIKTTGDLGEAAAVRSDDFEKVFYVSAVIEGRT